MRLFRAERGTAHVRRKSFARRWDFSRGLLTSRQTRDHKSIITNGRSLSVLDLGLDQRVEPLLGSSIEVLHRQALALAYQVCKEDGSCEEQVRERVLDALGSQAAPLGGAVGELGLLWQEALIVCLPRSQREGGSTKGGDGSEGVRE